ncbi:hypothetical protein E4P42_16715 [Mycobacterium sp. PS03-16]|uniref:hypothetical protein n=1 Tax=Mycobacterium sp. PS03-16 TaxID=2559611 RepID=UPI0010748A0A|nr:hypothetical protein [Mycobacterium sp. PS03-16]TFV57043.1 hypothetical protein E4P42_16715 [Mycobacterium sp. PS03-16]
MLPDETLAADQVFVNVGTERAVAEVDPVVALGVREHRELTGRQHLHPDRVRTPRGVGGGDEQHCAAAMLAEQLALVEPAGRSVGAQPHVGQRTVEAAHARGEPLAEIGVVDGVADQPDRGRGQVAQRHLGMGPRGGEQVAQSGDGLLGLPEPALHALEVAGQDLGTGVGVAGAQQSLDVGGGSTGGQVGCGPSPRRSFGGFPPGYAAPDQKSA